MSLATTCPSCSTCFRVVQDQLRVSEGWVRCGHCQQVFNALQSLFDLDAPQEPVALPSASAAPSPGRGIWQTEATARWMRRREQASPAHPPVSETPGDNAQEAPPAPVSSGRDPDVATPAWAQAEREEPLSDDLLAALQAEPAPGSSLDEAPDHDADAESDDARASAEVTADDSLDTPLARAVDEDPVGNETAFLPFPATLERREPVFEPTRYEAHGVEGLPAVGETPTAPIAEVHAGPEAAPSQSNEGEGLPSAAVFLSEVEPAHDGFPRLAEVPAFQGDGAAANNVPGETPELPQAPALDEPALPSFLAAGERRERLDRPLARWAFVGLAGLLVVALTLQVAWHWRDRLAMAWPVTAGPLSALCQLAGCELGPPRELNALVVDNTTLTRPPGSAGYRLTVQLHNTVMHPVAAPSFDLVLTDADGVVVARRTLQPADFNVQETALPASAEVQWSTEFTLAEGSLVGYTVAAFYP